MKTRDDLKYDLRMVRIKRGLNQKEMGKLIGLTGAAIGNWERGEDFPKMDHWEAIKRETGLDVEEYDNRYRQEAVVSHSISSPSINTHEGKTVVSIGQVDHGRGNLVELTEGEANLRAKFRRYGNMHLMDKWLKDLSIIEAASR